MGLGQGQDLRYVDVRHVNNKISLIGATDVVHKIEDAASGSLPLPSWDRIASFGSGLLKQADEDLNNAIKQWPIKEDVESFRATFRELLYSANAIRANFSHIAEKRGLTFEDISDELGDAFQAVLKELKAAFPPPDQAPSHEARQNMTRTALRKVEQALLDFARKQDVPEENVEALRASFDKLVPIVEKLVVITGAPALSGGVTCAYHVVGDLAEQHPILLDTLLFSATALLIPESWILRPLLSLFGFGPFGPVKGTSICKICLEMLVRR